MGSKFLKFVSLLIVINLNPVANVPLLESRFGGKYPIGSKCRVIHYGVDGLIKKDSTLMAIFEELLAMTTHRLKLVCKIDE